MADCVERAALLLRRTWIERVFFGFHVSTSARIRPTAETLRDHALHAACTRGRKQIVSALDAQSIAVRESAFELAKVRRVFEIGQLVHDHVRAHGAYGREYGVSVERVRDNWFRAKFLHEPRFRRRVRQSGYEMTLPNQTWNQPAANGARRARDKDTHGSSSLDNLLTSR